MSVDTFAVVPDELATAAKELTNIVDEVAGYSAAASSTDAATALNGSAFGESISAHATTVDRLGHAVGAGLTATRTAIENSVRDFTLVDTTNGTDIDNAGGRP